MGNPSEITPAFAAAQAQKYPMALPLGSVLNGRYVIRRVLGQGGFGITYAAWDHKYQALVAVKEYMPETYAMRQGGNPFITAYSAEMQEQFDYGKKSFLEEARVLAKFLGHPHIVGARSYFEENGTAYLVMEYVDGVSFKAYIKNRGGQTNWQEALWVLRPVMEALTAVHQEGILHRDVTPDNIYLTSGGGVKLLDFGAARYSLGDKSRSLDVILKAGYAPKEQYMRRGRQGPWTDVYSVAACFYAAITGYLPPESLERLEEDNLVPICNRGIHIPEQLENAILKGLAVDREDRFQTMGEFLQAMDGIYRDESLSGVIRERVLQMRSGEEKPVQPQNPLPSRTDWRPPTGPVQSIRGQQTETGAGSRHSAMPVAQAPVQVPMPPPQPVSTAAPPVKKKKTGLVIALSAAAVAAAAVVVILVVRGKAPQTPSGASSSVLQQQVTLPDQTETERPSWSDPGALPPEMPGPFEQDQEQAPSTGEATDGELLAQVQNTYCTTDTEQTPTLEEMFAVVFLDGFWEEEYAQEVQEPIVRFTGIGFDRLTNQRGEFMFIFRRDEAGEVYLHYLSVDGESVGANTKEYDVIFGAAHMYDLVSGGESGLLQLFYETLTDNMNGTSMSLEKTKFLLDLVGSSYDAMECPTGERLDLKVGATVLSYVDNRGSDLEAPRDKLLVMYLGPHNACLDVRSLSSFYLKVDFLEPEDSPLDSAHPGFITYEEMQTMDYTELILYSYERMARHGLDFAGALPFIQLYFNFFSWYNPVYNSDQMGDMVMEMTDQEALQLQDFSDTYSSRGFLEYENAWWDWYGS